MQIHISKIKSWLPHLIGILFVMLIPLFVFDRADNRLLYWKYSYYYQMCFMLVAFYINYIVIVPRLYFSKKKVYFFLAILTLTILILALFQIGYDILDFDGLRERLELKRFAKAEKREELFIHPKLIDNFYLLVLILSTSTGLAINQRNKQNEKEQQEKEKAHQDTELAFLKNQISPHFFFNALNNIYALIAIDGERAQQSVEKLSGLMRYLIYESDIKLIDLKKEFEFNGNYIELMRQRLTSKVNLDVSISEDIPNTEVPPLMFIPFIENAFKHGVSYREKSFIHISFKIEDNMVVFECENSIPSNDSMEEKVGGVGVNNIKKRLSLIYGNKAVLKMDTANNVFNVSLKIPLNN